MPESEQGLKRELNARQMAMVAVGGSIGTGLLLGSGAAIQAAGPALVVTYALSAVIAFTVAMALGEMSSAHPAAGSFRVYAEIYLNNWAGFIASYGYWISLVIAIGSELVAADTYMRAWFPHAPPAFWMIVFGLLLLAVNFFSVAYYGTFEYWFALIKVVTIFAFIAVGVGMLYLGKVHAQYSRHGGWAPHGWTAALLAISFGLFSFLGIEMVAVTSGEARSSHEVARATRMAFVTLTVVYVGAIAILAAVMPWRTAGTAESPFVTVFRLARIPAVGLIMNVVVLSAALSAANAALYVTSRMLFSLARAGCAPAGVGRLNRQGVPMAAIAASMAGIVLAIFFRLRAPEKAYLYMINVSLVGGMLAWLISLLAHVSFRARTPAAQLSQLGMRSPLGAAGSIFGFVTILAAVACTWWSGDSSVAAKSAIVYLGVLSAAYLLVRRK